MHVFSLNEILNFKNYTFFILMDGKGSDTIFHVHAVPTYNKSRELRHMRYNNQLDLQLYPYVVHNPQYLKPTDPEEAKIWEQARKNASASPNLIRDSKGKASIIDKIN